MKNKIISSHYRNSIVFILIIFGFQSCVSTKLNSIKDWEKHEWKTIKVDNKKIPTWEISKRKITGTNLHEYKIKGEVNASANSCLASFKQDIYNLANNSNNKKYPTYNIVEENEDSLLTYVIHKEPFPLKNTEMSVRYLFFNTQDESSSVSWKEDWKACPVQPSKKLSRVQSFRGSWNFFPVSDNLSTAVSRVQFDPKKMPRWLYEPMVLKFLKKGISDIRATTSKEST